tara:strand:+ start:1501 stop:2802 length:1302 start_codon:yes stop_codon:yes gene_type:complete
MPVYKFSQNDVFHNVLKTYPQIKYFMYNGSAYYNDVPDISGSFTGSVRCTDAGSISLFELNVDRKQDDNLGYITEVRDLPLGNIEPLKSVKNTGMIYQFMVKDATKLGFSSVSSTAFSKGILGEVFTGSLPYTSRITKEYYSAALERYTSPVIVETEDQGLDVTASGSVTHLYALKNTLNHYTYLSPHYEYSSSIVGRDLSAVEVGLVCVPTIFYGSKIKPGSVKLDFYVSGALVGRLEDKNQDGVLYQTAPNGAQGSGSVAGVTLYNEGFMVLTGAWDLTSGEYEEATGYGTSNDFPNWINFGQSISGSITAVSSSFLLEMSGTTTTQTLTMFATAPKGELNHSNNPTFPNYYTGSLAPSSSQAYIEDQLVGIKNVVSSAYTSPTASFERTTYISKVGIYDKNMNLIAIAKPATPIKKLANRGFTFKIELDT